MPPTHRAGGGRRGHRNWSLKVGGGLCTLSQGTGGGRGQATGEQEVEQLVLVCQGPPSFNTESLF